MLPAGDDRPHLARPSCRAASATLRHRPRPAHRAPPPPRPSRPSENTVTVRFRDRSGLPDRWEKVSNQAPVSRAADARSSGCWRGRR